jgi:hypothetical protein
MIRAISERLGRARFASAAILVCIGLAASPAAAQATPDNAARAAELKTAGDEAMDKLRFADAVDAYQRAFNISHEPALLYNLGRALEGLGSYPEALAKLEAFDEVAPPELKQKVPGLEKRIAELRQRVTTLVITVDVPGARILVRNAGVGVSPLGKPLRVSAGHAEIEIDADGYLQFKKELDLPGGGAATVDAHLSSKDKNGVLAVHASAPGAEVAVDGRRLGVAPLDTTITAGEHTIVIRHPDYRDFETQVSLKGGERRTVDAQLQSPRIYSRWWFWTAIGVAAAGGAVAAYAATTEKSPSKGSIAPGTIKVPAALALTGHF